MHPGRARGAHVGERLELLDGVSARPRVEGRWEGVMSRGVRGMGEGDLLCRGLHEGLGGLVDVSMSSRYPRDIERAVIVVIRAIPGQAPKNAGTAYGSE